MIRVTGVQSEPPSAGDSDCTKRRRSISHKKHHRHTYPNLPPVVDPYDSQESSFYSSSRPSTSVSGLSGFTLPGSVVDAIKKSPTLPCTSVSSSEDSNDIFHRQTSSSSLPQQKETLYERVKTDLETNPMVQRECALGKRIAFYRLGKELGCGNFSKVKLGVHCLTKEKVAVKIMDKSKMDQKAQRLLTREIANMELLHHPNVIRLFEVIETLSKVYLVQEYAGGGELYTFVHEQGKLTEEAAKPIFAQLVSAVTHLHMKGIVHRDIKAENVIFSQPGWIKLADFGFSCTYDSAKNLKTFCGSPPYAAPELFRDTDYIGTKVDTWALGITLYFMLVGVTPFRGETVNALKANILSGVYTIPDYVSSFAQHVITRLLDMEPGNRASCIEIKKMYWLRQCKFPESYLQINVRPCVDSIRKGDRTEHEVWSKLQQFGISEDMIHDCASKGAKDAIIGTYRIVLYQCQAPEHDKERIKVRDHVHKLAERNRQAKAALAPPKSKACSIM